MILETGLGQRSNIKGYYSQKYFGLRLEFALFGSYKNIIMIKGQIRL